MKTVSELKEIHKIHNTSLWNNLNSRRAFLQKEIEATKQAHTEKILRAKRKFMKKAIASCGEPEPSDNIVLQDIEFDYPRSGNAKPSYSYKYQDLLQFHAVILLRNNFALPHTENHRNYPADTFTDEDLISVYETALGEDFIPPENTELSALEAELDESKWFIKQLHGERNIDIEEKLMEELAEARKIIEAYQRPDGNPMPIEKARKIMNEQTHDVGKANAPEHMNAEEMSKHIDSSYGLPSGTEFLGHYNGKA